jgi:hypothetical protein
MIDIASGDAGSGAVWSVRQAYGLCFVQREEEAVTRWRALRTTTTSVPRGLLVLVGEDVNESGSEGNTER